GRSNLQATDQSRGRIRWIENDECSARFKHGEDCANQGRAAVTIDCDSVVGLDATCAQVVGELVASPIQFLIGPILMWIDDSELVRTSSGLTREQSLNRFSLLGVE